MLARRVLSPSSCADYFRSYCVHGMGARCAGVAGVAAMQWRLLASTPTCAFRHQPPPQHCVVEFFLLPHSTVITKQPQPTSEIVSECVRVCMLCMLQNMCATLVMCVRVSVGVGVCVCCGCMTGVERGFALSHVMLYYERVGIATASSFSQSGAVAEFPANSHTLTHYIQKPMCI